MIFHPTVFEQAGAVWGLAKAQRVPKDGQNAIGFAGNQRNENRGLPCIKHSNLARWGWFG
jgi:hypothetical protein